MDEKRLFDMEQKLEKISLNLEKSKIAEYVDIMNKPIRLIYLNFIGGLARGLGTAIGLTVLAAALVCILQQIVDLPLIGKYIAELIQIIEDNR